jgi:hypothetical protein
MSGAGPADTIIDGALAQLRALGTQQAEVDRVANMLRTLASQNPRPCRVDLGNGLVIHLPGAAGARGFRQAAGGTEPTRH